MARPKTATPTRRTRRWTLVTGTAAAATVAALTLAAPAGAAPLDERPFAPTDIALLNTQTYPAGPPMVPAPGPAPTEAQLTTQLTETLVRRCPARTPEGVALFQSDPQLLADIPHPTLRAAVASLLCTYGEPGIDALRSGTLFERVQFGTTPDPNAAAQVVPPGPGDTLPTIVVNDRYQFEDFRVLASILFHETLHQDLPVSGKEELAATALQTLVYAQQILNTPDVATSGTELPRRQNTSLMARINSGPGQRLGLFTANGPNVFPGGNPLPYFAAAFEPLGGDTPGNATLHAALALLGGTPPPDAGFDDTTLSYIDLTQGLSGDQVLQAARILRLDIPTAPPFGSLGS